MGHRLAWAFTGLLLGGLAVGFLLLRPLSSQGWETLFPAVKEDLQERMGFLPRHVRILDTLDLTGDGRPEALVAYGAGASLEEVAVYARSKGKPVLLMRKTNGRTEPMILRRGGGGAGRYGADFWFTEDHLPVEGAFSFEGMPADSCSARVFRWDPGARVFVVDSERTPREKERYCRKVCMELRNTPIRELAAPHCSGLD